MKKGDVDKALEYYTITWNMRNKIFGAEHPDTLASYNNIAYAYSQQGNYEKALALHKNILEIKIAKSGESLNTATSYNNIGACYYRLGNYEEALTWFHKSLLIHKAAFGVDNYETTNVENNLRLTYEAAQTSNQNKYPLTFEEWQDE
jgi:pentatricopeptide repeat protein